MNERVMPECHRCRFDGAGSLRCLSCKGPPESIGGGRQRLWLENDRGIDVIKPSVEEAAQRMADETARGPDQRMYPAETLAAALHVLLKLNRVTHKIVCARLSDPHQPLRVLAKRHRISIKSVHMRLKQAEKQCAELSGILTRTNRRRSEGGTETVNRTGTAIGDSEKQTKAHTRHTQRSWYGR